MLYDDLIQSLPSNFQWFKDLHQPSPPKLIWLKSPTCCDNVMVQLNAAEVLCETCNRLEKYEFHELSYTKTRYNPMRQFDIEIRRILGHEVLNAKLLVHFQDSCDIATVRAQAKKINHPRLYKLAPSILSRLGYPPPDLSFEVLTQLRMMYHTVIYEGSWPSSVPILFVIYKLCDNVIHDSEGRRILSYIHLPKSKTLLKHERKWKDVCNHLNLKYPILKLF